MRRLDRLYVDWPELVVLPAARGDPLFDRLPDRTVVLEWHVDAIEPPPGATVLAETAGPGCAIFRAGPAAWGSQIHLELTPEMLSGWLSDPPCVTGWRRSAWTSPPSCGTRRRASGGRERPRAP